MENEEQKHGCIGLSEEQLRQVIRTTVHETCIMLGIDIENPLETQKDFQSLREWRELLTSIKNKGTLAAVGFVTLAVLAFVVAEMKHVLIR